MPTCDQGTFGKVKHAEHAVTRQQVAIKVLDRLKIQQLNMGTQIKREISLMKLMKNQHIVQLHVSLNTVNLFISLKEYIITHDTLIPI